MKKTTILAVSLLLACSGSAFADWGTGNWAGNYYFNDETVDTLKATDYDAFSLKTGKKNTATVALLEMKDGATATVAANSGGSGGADLSLTVSSLSGKNVTLVVDANQSLTLNGLSSGSSINSITVDGTLTLGKDVQGLNNFTFGANGKIGGTYNLGQYFKDSVTFTLTNTGVIETKLNSGENYTQELTADSAAIWNAEKISTVTLNTGVENITSNEKVIYFSDGKYYEGAAWTNSGQTVTLSDEIDVLAASTAYIVAGLGGTKVTSLSAIITAPIPEPSAFGLLAGLGALASVASRRRRK